MDIRSKIREWLLEDFGSAPLQYDPEKEPLCMAELRSKSDAILAGSPFFLLILEETQYRRFQKRKSYQPLYRKYRATRGKFQITVHEPLDFYFVLDNRFSIIINKWVEGKVKIRKQ